MASGSRIPELPKSDIESLHEDGFFVVSTNSQSYSVPLSDLKDVAFTGKYVDLEGAPTVNNKTITIQGNGTKIDSFTTNQSSNKTINITPEKIGAQPKLSKAGSKTQPVYVDTDGTVKACDTISGAGTLNTANSSSLATNSSESLSGAVKLHKIAKTGKYSDLVGTPAEKTVDQTYKSTSENPASGKAIKDALDQTVGLNLGSSSQPVYVKDGKLAKGNTIPTVNDSVIKITANGNSGSFSLNQSGGSTINLGSPAVPGNATIRIKGSGGTVLGSFTTNQSADSYITITPYGIGAQYSMSFPIGASSGGTGKNNLKDAENALIWALDVNNTAPKDDDYFVSQYVNGNSSSVNNKTFHKKKFSALWSWITSKLASTYNRMFGIKWGYKATSTRTEYLYYIPVAIIGWAASADEGIISIVGRCTDSSGKGWSQMNGQNSATPSFACYMIVNVGIGDYEITGLGKNSNQSWELAQGRFVPVIAYNGKYYKFDNT